MSLIPTNAQDVVGVLNSSFAPVFQKARAMKVTITPSSKTMEHPMETGASVTDHRIILPLAAELSVVCASEDYRSVYQQIRDLFKKGELLTVQTRVDSYPSMIIEKMPHDETPDMMGGVAVGITLKEVMFVQPQFSAFNVAKPKDSNTVQRGQQQGATPPASRKSSVLGGFFK